MADYRAAIERMMATPHGFEWLPQIWHVIYEEGIRGNHILFQDADLIAFRQAMAQGKSNWTTELNGDISEKIEEKIEVQAIRLLRLNNIDIIRRRVHLMPQDEKLALFIIYQCGLELWGSALKRSLN